MYHAWLFLRHFPPPTCSSQCNALRVIQRICTSQEKELHPYTIEEVAVPLEWQQRHGINMTCAISLPPQTEGYR